MAISLEGKTAIVTSTPQSVGTAIAQKFVEAGANVMLAACDDRKATCGVIEGDSAQIERFSFALQDKLCITNLIAATVNRFERIDILVNAVQNTSDPGTFLDVGTDQFDAAFGDNVRGVFQLSQAVARRMIEQREKDDPGKDTSAIVNISSIAARRTVPGLLAYSVSCAALDQLTRSMAASMAQYGVRVNGVALGSVLTERLRIAFRENADLRDDMIAVTPMGRLADTEEAAETVLFLASPHAAYITGQIVSVDGGRTLLDPLASPIR
ncbi:MAG: SDR family oxidoreductase [Pseudomonadota bacterium]